MCPLLPLSEAFFISYVFIMNHNNYVLLKKPKRTIDDLDLFDTPMVGIFKNKKYTAYTLLTLAGIKVKNLNDLEIKVEDFMANPDKGKRNIRMDARINIKNSNTRANVEIQRIRNGDELARALNYASFLVSDFPKGLETIPATENIVIFICAFDPFENTEYAGQTRMRFKLRSVDDEEKFHTLSGKPYPFDGLTIMIYNGAQDWEKNPPKSELEERIRVYLEDMRKTDPKEMTSDIAKTACLEYKGDSEVMDKTKAWIRYNFEEQFKEQEEYYEKKIRLIKEEDEKKLLESEKKLQTQKEESDRKLLESKKKLQTQKEESDRKLLESEKQIQALKERIKALEAAEVLNQMR